jgi:hypothetical protein
MPHCPSYAELDELLKTCSLWEGRNVYLPSEQLKAVIVDLKQCRAKLKELAAAGQHPDGVKKTR